MEDFEPEFDEGSDLDNWETEQVFQDHEGDDFEPSEDSYLDSTYEDRYDYDCEG
jgi:hypothetical protein